MKGSMHWQGASSIRDRGLVCFLKAADHIGEVTTHSIEIIHPCHPMFAIASTIRMSISHGYGVQH